MVFQIPEGLNPVLYPLAWLVGSWQGNGHMFGPDGAETEIGQVVEFVSNGGPYLHYAMQTYTLDEDKQPLAPVTMEAGFWRPQPNKTDVEVVMCAPEGWSEVWVGQMEPAKLQMVTDAVVRTQGAEVAYTGGSRLYGLVEGDLWWSLDHATDEQGLTPYLVARLKRVG